MKNTMKTILAAASIALVALGAEAGSGNDAEFKYLEPVYKTAGVAASGIDRWETNTLEYAYDMTDKHIVTSAVGAVTWGAAGVTNWYVVTNGKFQIDGNVTCAGHVNLILCDGAKLTVAGTAESVAAIVTDTAGSFTVYGSTVGNGHLIATATNDGSDKKTGYCAGIGGSKGVGGKNITINGGFIEATGGQRGAGIGGGGVYYAATKCLAAGTMIRMADGTEKAIENIAEGDCVATFDHECGTNAAARVFLVSQGETKELPFTLTFDSGAATLSIAGCHDLLEKTSRRYVTITEANASGYVGKFFYGADGRWHELTGVRQATEKSDYYSIYTAQHLNAFANGILTVPDDVDYLLNIYELNENLKADAAQLAADIAQYGLADFDETADLYGISRAWFDDAGTKYYPVAIGKGLVTREGLEAIFASVRDPASADVNPLSSVERPLSAPLFAAAPMLASVVSTDPTLEDAKAGVLTLGEGVIVTDNTGKSQTSNIYLTPYESGWPAYIALAANHAGICAGVARSSGAGQFTANGSVTLSDVALFTSDDPAYIVRFVDDHLELTLPDVAYTAPVYVTEGDPTSGIDHWVTNNCYAYTVIDDSASYWEEGWYVVTNEVTISDRIECEGDVHLILCPGAKLIAAYGITVNPDDASLAIYGQPDGAGRLEATVEDEKFYAAIGGTTGSGGDGGNVTINAGTIVATAGARYAAAIGGGDGRDGVNLIINGGTVKAIAGELAAAIGGGRGGKADGLVINGGTIAANGNFIGNDNSEIIGSGKNGGESTEVVIAPTANILFSILGAEDSLPTDFTGFVILTPMTQSVERVLVSGLDASAAWNIFSLTNTATAATSNITVNGSMVLFANRLLNLVFADSKLTLEQYQYSIITNLFVEHTTAVVYTNGAAAVVGPSGLPVTNGTPASVVFIPEDGYFFADGTMAVTNVLDTTKNPAEAVGALPAAPTQHKHCVCGDGACAHGEHSHEVLVWRPWTSTTSLPDTAGNWYLMNDVTVNSKWTPADGTRLCLNGKTVTSTTTECAIAVEVGISFLITDCNTVPGCVSHTGASGVNTYGVNVVGEETEGQPTGCFTAYRIALANHPSGGVFSGPHAFAALYDVAVTNNDAQGLLVSRVSTNFVFGGIIAGNHGYGIKADTATVLIEGALITGNASASNGGGIYCEGSEITLCDVTVIGNQAATHGGGVYIGPRQTGRYPWDVKQSVVILDGETVITNNVVGGGSVGNLYLDGGASFVSLAADHGVLDVGVSLSAGTGRLTTTDNVTASDAAFFTSDNPAYIVRFVGDHLEITVPDVTFAPVPVDHTTAAVYTNDAPVEKLGEVYLVPSNMTATVVYTADEGYYFVGGTTVKTNEVDTTKNPAKVIGELPVVLEPVKYCEPIYIGGIATNGIDHWVTNTCANYTIVTNEPTRAGHRWGKDGEATWLVVADSDVVIDDYVRCFGHVNLILCDGADLKVTNGIRTDSNTLTIYAGLEGTGKLIAECSGPSAGIGCGHTGSGNNITINGGRITAIGGDNSAGIGGGLQGSASNIVINAGIVTAIGKGTDGGGAGIGGGRTGLGQDITINGGMVVATGAVSAAGIGGGSGKPGMRITINGGEVQAVGGSFGAGIGGGQSGTGSRITISGGNVQAKAGTCAAGIGGGSNVDGSDIAIIGGTVTAVGGNLAAGIGGGSSGAGSRILIDGCTVMAIGGYLGAGIGGGQWGGASNITIGAAEVFVASARYMDGNLVTVADLIGCGGESSAVAEDVTIAETAQIFFNLTGSYDRSAEEWIEEIAPMPTDVEGFVLMTPERQTENRVLVGGCGAQGLSALPVFALTNAVTGATDEIAVNGAEITFAHTYCSLTNMNGNLTFAIRPPALTITQQPDVTNGYAIIASTDGNNGITNYAWCIESTETTGFVALTNRAEIYAGTVSGTDIASGEYSGDDNFVMLAWEYGDLPPDGELRFSCSTELADGAPYFDMEAGDLGTLSQNGTECVWRYKDYYGTYYYLCVCAKAGVTTSFTIQNLRLVSASYEPVAQGKTLTALPADVGLKGSNYVCRVTYGHENVFYTDASEEFPFWGYPIVATPTPVDHTTLAVYTNGVLSSEGEAGKWAAWSNETATVVYTADEGYYFVGGTTVKTNEVDTTKNPAKVIGELPVVIPPVKYTKPVYVDNTASNGIAYWVTNTCYNYTAATSAESQVTWGAAGVTNWFAVTNNVQIKGGVVCQGHVNLILCEGAKLVVTNAANAGIATDMNGSFTVYGQPDGAGELAAFGNAGAGIGCGAYANKSGKNITINGGVVTATSCDVGAGIGGGGGSTGENITINGGVVTATSCGYGAGIGGGAWGGTGGTNITINGGIVMANGGLYAAGIGGGGGNAGSYITINAGMVTARGIDCGAGIGGGSGGSGSNVAIKGGEVTAIGGKFAAGIGGGSGGVGSNITISNAVVFAGAVPGLSATVSELVIPDVIGNGDNDTTPASGIVIDPSAKVFFNLTGFWDGENKVWLEEMAPMPESFDGFVIMTPETQAVDRVLVGGIDNWTAATTFALTNAATGATGAIGADGAMLLFAERLLELPCADNALTLKAYEYSTINPPADIENTTAKVYTNGIEAVVGGGLPVTNGTPAYVVYTAAKGYAFADGPTVKTNKFDTSKNPATVVGEPVVPVAIPADIVIAGEGTLPEPYDGMERYPSFSEAYANAIVMWVTNVHVFGMQNLVTNPPQKVAWKLELVDGASISIATIDKGEGMSGELVPMTNLLEAITGEGFIILSVTNGTPGAAEYKLALEALIGAEPIKVLYTNFEPERTKEKNPEGKDVTSEELDVDETSKIDLETGAIVLPGVDTDGKVTVDVKDGTTNDVVVAGKLVSREWDVVIVNETTNTLTVGAVETGMNVLITNVTDVGKIVTLEQVIAGKNIQIENNGHLDANVNASADIMIDNKSPHTIVGMYRAGGAINITGEYGSLSNVVIDAVGTLSVSGTNIISGPVDLRADTIGFAFNTRTDWSVEGDNHEAMIDFADVESSDAFGIRVDAAQATGDTCGTYVLATNAASAADISFEVTAPDGAVLATLKANGESQYVGAKKYTLSVNEADELVFEIAYGQFSISYDAQDGKWANGQTVSNIATQVSGGYVLPAEDPTRAKYVFMGWFASWTNGAAKIENGTPLTLLTNHTIYAKWVSGAMPEGMCAIQGKDIDGSATMVLGAKTNAAGQVVAEAQIANGEFVIPERIGNDVNSKFITAIAREAYAKPNYDDKVADDKKLRSVYLPGYLTRVGDAAFYACKNLTNITFAATRDYRTNQRTTVRLGSRTFAGCAIKTLVVPAGTKVYLGANSFAQCPNLTEIFVYGEITGIDNAPFSKIGGGQEVTVHLSPDYAADAAFVARLTKDMSTAKVKIATEPLGQARIENFDVSGTEITVTFAVQFDSPWGVVNEKSVTLFYSNDPGELKNFVGTGNVLYPTSVAGPDASGAYTATFYKEGDPSGDSKFYRLTVGAEK